MRPMMKLLPQFDMVAWAQPLARIEEGKTSAGMAHGMGPQVAMKGQPESIVARHRVRLTSECEHEKEQESSRNPALCGMSGPEE